jgi:hypothetical protein
MKIPNKKSICKKALDIVSGRDKQFQLPSSRTATGQGIFLIVCPVRRHYEYRKIFVE